jgi:hypothetical protein
MPSQAVNRPTCAAAPNARHAGPTHAARNPVCAHSRLGPTPLFLIVAALLLCSLPASAQFGARQTVFRESVESWTGTFTFTLSDSGNMPAGPIPGTGGSFSAQNEAKGTVSLHRDDKIGGWTGTVNGNYTINEKQTIFSPACTTDTSVVGQGGLAIDAFGKPITFSLTMDLHSDNWSFWPISQYVPAQVSGKATCAGMSMPGQDRQLGVRFGPLNTKMGLPLPLDTFHLKGSAKIPWTACSYVSSGDCFFIFTYDLRPVTKELELQIEPIGYDSWRPQAGNNEDDIGNTLPVDLHLRLSDGSKPKVGAIRFVIDLVKTSKEPGIAMNFPAAAKAKKTFDLKMIDKNNPKTLVLRPGGDGQHAETVGGPYFDYSLTLTSYDWGGWTILKATAYLPGGSTVVGHLINDDSMKDVRIPKRKADSHIADAWRDHTEGATGKDDDDSDNEPEGDGEKGDGLTLYEEYRGFMENSKHIEGKPNKKDLFIRNRIGGDAEDGIFIFKEDSKIEVHKDMQDAELSDDRLVNFNHDQGAHKTEQHGVILVTDPAMDGANAWEHTGQLNPGPPRNTELVKVQPASKASETLGTDTGTQVQGGMSSSDKMIAFPRMVAHELMHTVGVWHHGDNADYMWYTKAPHLISPLDPNFPAGMQPFFTSDWAYYNPDGTMYSASPLGGVEKMYVFTEDGKDFAQCLYKYFLGDPQRFPDYYKLNPDALKSLGHWSGASKIVGVKGGQDSGNEQCLMRYYFPQFYPKDGTNDTFYTRYQCESPFRLLDEPIGVQIDSSPKGTGVNDESRSPQSRYFDAHDSRGDCIHQIVVNDSANPKDRSIKDPAQ